MRFDLYGLSLIITTGKANLLSWSASSRRFQFDAIQGNPISAIDAILSDRKQQPFIECLSQQAAHLSSTWVVGEVSRENYFFITLSWIWVL